MAHRPFSGTPSSRAPRVETGFEEGGCRTKKEWRYMESRNFIQQRGLNCAKLRSSLCHSGPNLQTENIWEVLHQNQAICHILPKMRYLHHNLNLEIRFLIMQTLFSRSRDMLIWSGISREYRKWENCIHCTQH